MKFQTLYLFKLPEESWKALSKGQLENGCELSF